MKFKELLLREEIVSRTLGPLFCLGSGRSFRGHWTLIFQFVWALVAALCLGALLSTTKEWCTSLIRRLSPMDRDFHL
jgi:hypothetical protein